MKNNLKQAALVFALAFAACDGDQVDGDGTAGGESRTLLFDVSDLPELGSDFVYEGWLVGPSGPRSTGRFTVNASGSMVPAEFEITGRQAEAASAAVITIEPAAVVDAYPSETHILAGTLDQGIAALSIADEKALGSDFADASGTFLLATPSTAEDTSDNLQGIWWVTGDPPTASLDLPPLPDGWLFEGWVATDEEPISTGKFARPDVPDDDGAGPAAGPDGGPPFPGQDFIDPPLVLGPSFAAVITIEPDPDDSPEPFPMRPLVKAAIASVPAPAEQAMENRTLGSAPSGLAIIE